MKVQNINNPQIKFAQNSAPITVSTNQPAEMKDLPSITTVPAQYVTVNSPSGYIKVGEYEFFDGIKSHIYKLSNGQTVVLTPTKGDLKINTDINCGSINEPDNLRGISHYIEHNLFNGSKNIKPAEFFKKVHSLGADTNAGTGTNATNYYISGCPATDENLSQLVSMHADMIQNPLFGNEQLEKEKEIVNSEINMYASMPDEKIRNKAMFQLFQINSTSDDLIAGRVANINALTRDDVVNYYNINYTPEKMTTFLTGEFNPDKAIDLIAKNFTKQLTPLAQTQIHEELKPIEKSVRSDMYLPNIDVAKFMLMMKGPDKSNIKENVCISMIWDILANGDYPMLKKALDKFNCTPEAGYDQIGNKNNSPNLLLLTGDCKDKDMEEVLKTIYSTIFSFKNTDVSEDLEISKKKKLKHFYKLSEDGDAINDYLRQNLTSYTPDEVKQMPAIIKSVTQDDLKQVFDKYFDLNKVSLVVAHPAKKEQGVSFKGRLADKKLDLSEFRYAQLQNNSQVYLKDDNSKLKSFALSIKSDIPANVNPMLPDVFSKLFAKGSIFLNDEQFLKGLGKRGVGLEVNVSNSGIMMRGDALDEDINFALEKAIELLNNPKFNQKDFDDVKKQVALSIESDEKSPFDFAGEVLSPQVKSASTKEQKLKALEELTLGDLLGFVQYLKMNGSNYFIWNKKDVPYALTQLGTFQKPQNQKYMSYAPLEQDVLKTQVLEKKQAKIAQFYKFECGDSPSEIARLQLLNEILGGSSSSRLFTDLREKRKLAYSVRSSVEKEGNTGTIALTIGTTTDNPNDANASSANITKSLDGFKYNIDRLMNEPVPESEFADAKKYLKAELCASLKTNDSKMDGVLRNIIKYGDADFMNKLSDEIDKITPLELQQTAQKVFAGKKFTSIVASEKTLKELNLPLS